MNNPETLPNPKFHIQSIAEQQPLPGELYDMAIPFRHVEILSVNENHIRFMWWNRKETLCTTIASLSWWNEQKKTKIP